MYSSCNAALVGGMVSHLRCFRENISKRAVFTANVVVVLSDMMTTKSFNALYVLVTDGSRYFAQRNKRICRIIKGRFLFLQSRRGGYKDICSCKTYDRSRIENIVTSTDTDVDLAISMLEKLKIDKL
jgi:hypothetical protein